MKKLLTLSVAFALCATFAVAQQTCTATTSSVIGSYTYTATEFPLGTMAVTPPGTTTNTQPYSNTQVGNLIQALNGGGAFANTNVFYFDGNGNVSIASTASSFSATTIVGSYTVNSDCTINVKLTDVFNTTSTSVGANPTQGTASLIGIVLGGGTEIELSVAQSATSTNGNMPLVTGEFASRLSIQLIRTFSYGCTNASLTGSYGLVGNGFVLVGASTTSAGTAQPVSVLGVVTFDGAGNVIPQTVGSGSPLGSFQYKGTYTVNLNCSGTMTLGPVPATTTTTTTTTTSPSLTVNFVLTPPITYPTTNAYSATPSGNAARPGIEFNLTSAGETLSGFGIAQ
jgi:hypothetical protein